MLPERLVTLSIDYNDISIKCNILLSEPLKTLIDMI